MCVRFDLFDSRTKLRNREMFDFKDPAFKLFGKTIPLPESQIPIESGKKSDQECQIPVDSEDKDACKETTKSDSDESPKEEPCMADKCSALNNSVEDIHQTPTTEENKATMDLNLKEDQVETDTSGQEKVLKKPDKVIPCPRCNSLDTKFCYYNNYNVNQPRHFCKKCQRYWTAGGTMRNVPVGAGRRKTKHTTSQYRHIMMSSEAMLTTQVDSPDSANHQVLLSARLSAPSRPIKGNETVLKFGSGPDVPLCESMATALNLGDKKRKAEMGVMVCGENGEEPSCGSSAMASTCNENEMPKNVAQMEPLGLPGSCNGFTPAHHLQCYPVPPWVYPWNSGWNNAAAIAAGQCSSELVYGLDNSHPRPIQSGSTSLVATPAYCTPNIPLPFVPTSYWGCMPSWAVREWKLPQIGSNGSVSPSSSTSNSGRSSNGSPTLGKHSKATNLQREEKLEKCFWVPKTLRIDNPDEAAKSSIWDTLGIKPGQNEPITKGGIFKAFQPKMEGNCHASDTAQVLQANPAALSRFQTFQESA